MARRGSAVTIRLGGAIDHRGVAVIDEDDIASPMEDNSTIAPWIDVPPDPPPKTPTRTFGFSQKASFSSLISMRQGSTSSLRYGSRPSESQTTLSIPNGKRRSTDDDSSRALLDSGSSSYSGELRKPKSSLNLNINPFSRLRTRSKANLRAEEMEEEHPSLRAPPPPLPDSSFLDVAAGQSTASLVSIVSSSKRAKSPRIKKKSMEPTPPPPPPKDALSPFPPPLHIDMDFGNMDGIIDPSLALAADPSSSRSMSLQGSSTGINGESGTHTPIPSTDFRSHLHPPLLSATEFRDPFSPTPTPIKDKRKGLPIIPRGDYRKVSPTTLLPSDEAPVPAFLAGYGIPGSPAWIPPDSWAVEKKDGEAQDEGDPSDDEEGHTATNGVHPAGMNGSHPPFTEIHPPLPSASSISTIASSSKPKPDSKSAFVQCPGYPADLRRPSVPESTYKLLIGCADGAVETQTRISTRPSDTVASLGPILDRDLLGGAQRMPHRLYLKERGRGDLYNHLERVLAPTEKPADIVRRRMEQAGYDRSDGARLLENDGYSFLLSFVYKSQLLGPAESEEIKLETFDYVNLTGHSLRAIPVLLHKHADSIVMLKLSRNPMLEIPLDFIQSCTSLRDLKLSNMAMKKVPTSLRHSDTLQRLNLSSNRISDLDDAHLGSIPELRTLLVQNNRIERLPWHFPRLQELLTLNISNNKFSTFPSAVTLLTKLEELDVSFNMISELPPEISKLKSLERLTIVGNQISRFPDEFAQLGKLQMLDCRRNQISDLTVVCMLPDIMHLSADRNVVHALDLSLGPKLTTLDAAHNDITRLVLVPGPVGMSPYALTSLNLSHAKLSSLDDLVLGQLTSLRTLHLDHNSFRIIPDSLGDLRSLETLSCSDNKLDALPSTIGRLQKLETLDAHNNSLTQLPASLWNCASLIKINVTSNFISTWHDPPFVPVAEPFSSEGSLSVPRSSERKSSIASLASPRSFPSLVYSLQRLYLGENRLTDDVIRPLMIFKELHVLNLSFNEIQDLPPRFFRNMTNLEEIYLSGNRLTSIPAEDLPGLKRLSVLFLNGNKLHTLPQELGKVAKLSVLDVGSNNLKYNINNTEFDWNWKFNTNLKYLNLSGNKHLQIKSDVKQNRRFSRDFASFVRKTESNFAKLTQLRVLGLMDVTIGTNDSGNNEDIPDEAEDRRIRTSLSTTNGMGYGIADALWDNDSLNILDLVHEFRQHDREGEAIFAIFSRTQRADARTLGPKPTKLVKFLHDKFVDVFRDEQQSLDTNEDIPDALRRTFLKLDRDLHDYLFPPDGTKAPVTDSALLKSGAACISLYFRKKTMYVANVGDALAVVSSAGVAHAVSRKHHPYDRGETARIRAAEGWVSPSGLVNGEFDVSRAFGFFHLLPVINARPDVFVHDLTDLDEFVIVATRGLWEYVPYQTAVDIARTALRSDRADPMIAAQKLRDFAISYGAESGIMIMVICVADLFNDFRSRQPIIDPIIDTHVYRNNIKKKDVLFDHSIDRLDGEVPAPTGHVALAFTDIRNSTHLWEVNPGMATAMRLHNSLLRRQLRFCGGYEVKTEGDAFICSFPTTLAAVWWCLSIQNQLLHEPWPLEILECEDGKAIHDAEGKLIARGLSVRVGIHCGMPVCEPDPITHRMDYFGPMVNRSARISSTAAGGQVMCSAEVIREINAKVLETEPETQYSRSQPKEAVHALRRMGLVVIPFGEVKLKGLEVPEILSLIYPADLVGRQDLKEGPADPNASGSRVQFSIAQMIELGLLCLRVEALASGRVFRPKTGRKDSLQPQQSEDAEEDAEDDEPTSIFIDGNPDLLLPPMKESSSDSDLMMVLDSLSVRIHNALALLCQRSSPAIPKDTLLSALMHSGELDERTLQYIASVLNTL